MKSFGSSCLDRARAFGALGSLAITLAGCSDDGDPANGRASVLVEPEDTITSGLKAGTGVEDIRDGWSVTFETYLATLGKIELHLATDESVKAHADELYVVDLVKIPSDGEVLWEFDELTAGRYEFNYHLGGAGHDAVRHSTASKADFDLMVEADLSYLIRGELTAAEGRSCPPETLANPGSRKSVGTNSAGDPCYENPTLKFTFGVGAETAFGPCELDGVPGFSVPEGGTGTVAATIHGDHLFFNGFPTGDEGGIQRLAQWLADSDLNLDGEVTRAELESLKIGDLAELDDRFQLGGAPTTLSDMWDYVSAQLKTQGHMDGEGECPADGEGHSHDEGEEHSH